MLIQQAHPTALVASGAISSLRARQEGCADDMILTPHTPFSVGRFLVSPLSRLTDSGEYSASISIRSGRGMGTHDRVFRLLPRFNTHHAALEYAAHEGRAIILARSAA